ASRSSAGTTGFSPGSAPASTGAGATRGVVGALSAEQEKRRASAPALLKTERGTNTKTIARHGGNDHGSLWARFGPIVAAHVEPDRRGPQEAGASEADVCVERPSLGFVLESLGHGELGAIFEGGHFGGRVVSRLAEIEPTEQRCAPDARVQLPALVHRLASLAWLRCDCADRNAL